MDGKKDWKDRWTDRLANRKAVLNAVLVSLAGVLFLTGIYLVHLKRENREIRQRLEREIQQGIAGEVFRFHVVANSDREEDQEVKLKVKTEITEYLEELLPEETNLEKTKEAVLTHLPEIEDRAEEVMNREGFDYEAQAVVEKTWFPEKTYGDCTVPAGEYEALNLRLGKAQGHNWWCMLYPSLCFIDETYGVVTEDKKEELKDVLTEEEFLEILKDPEKKEKVRIGFRWFSS